MFTILLRHLFTVAWLTCFLYQMVVLRIYGTFKKCSKKDRVVLKLMMDSQLRSDLTVYTFTISFKIIEIQEGLKKTTSAPWRENRILLISANEEDNLQLQRKLVILHVQGNLHEICWKLLVEFKLKTSAMLHLK